MPPRHAYWTILVDDQPTAFRAHDADELMPTLNRLKDKHASAVLKWFERGKLWDSKDAARAEGLGRGERRWQGPRPERPADSPPRDRNWRPGGEHRDARQKYKEAKKAKWTRFKKNIRDRAERARLPAASEADPRKFSPPHGDPLRSKARRDRPPGQQGGWKGRDRSWDDRPERPARDRQRDEWRSDRPQTGRPPKRENPWGDRPDRPPRDRERSDRHDDRDRGARAKNRARPWGQRPDRPPHDRPLGGRQSEGREPSSKWSKSGGQKKPFGAKKPWGFKPGGPGGPGRPRGPKGEGQRPRSRGPGRAGGRPNPRGPRGPRKPRDDE